MRQNQQQPSKTFVLELLTAWMVGGLPTFTQSNSLSLIEDYSWFHRHNSLLIVHDSFFKIIHPLTWFIQGTCATFFILLIPISRSHFFLLSNHGPFLSDFSISLLLFHLSDTMVLIIFVKYLNSKHNDGKYGLDWTASRRPEDRGSHYLWATDSRHFWLWKVAFIIFMRNCEFNIC